MDSGLKGMRWNMNNEIDNEHCRWRATLKNDIKKQCISKYMFCDSV